MDVNQKAYNASKWSLITEILSKLMLPVTNMVLARLLSPEAFGMVATITMVTSFADIFADAGFQKFLIQKEFHDDKELDNNTNVAFWTNLIVSVILWFIICVTRDRIAELVGSEGLGNAIAIASISVPLTAFSSIQLARYKRALDFKSIFYARLIGILVPIFVTIPLAFIMKNFWALVIGTIATNISNAVLLTLRSKWKPQLYYNYPQFRAMIGFSLWTLIEQLLGWANANVGVFIVGRFLSAYYLGLYKTSMSTANQVLNIFINALSPVILSTLSKLKDNEDNYTEAFYTFEKKIGILIIPIGIGMFTYRVLFTKLLLGAQWYEATEFMGLWGLMRSILIVFGMFSMEVFVSKGKPQVSVISQILELIVFIPVLLWAAPSGYDTLYKCRCAIVIWSIIVRCSLLYRVAGISVFRIFHDNRIYIFAAFIMGAAGWAFIKLSSSAIWQLISVPGCAVLYFLLLTIIPSTRDDIKLTLKSFLQKEEHI